MQPYENLDTDLASRRRRRVLMWAGVSVLVLFAFGVGFVALFRNNGIFKTYQVPSGAMKPTLQVNEIIFADLMAYRNDRMPSFGEILVFRPPKEALSPRDTEPDIVYVSRCMGLPGDLIEVRGGILFRTGREVKEPYVSHAFGGDKMAWDFKLVKFRGEIWPLLWGSDELPNLTGRSAEKFWVSDEDTAKELAALPAEPIPPGFILTMGDNREESFDGRMWGLVPRKNLVGRVQMNMR